MPQIQPLAQMQRLLGIMLQLRDPETGCPWDKEQTFDSIVPFTIEEVYEVADAIASGDMAEIKDELGDLLFQVVFYAQLGQEQDEFDFEAIAKAIGDKLVRRHPHVFADQQLDDSKAVKERWEQIKQQERAEKGLLEDNSILAHIPAGMAPLIKAEKIQRKCAKVGFDWPDAQQVIDKIHEEIEEVQAELDQSEVDQLAVEEEMGDLLFAVVNLSRHLKVNPEQALIKANQKFERRFRALENVFADKQQALEDADLESMENVWQQVKKA